MAANGGNPRRPSCCEFWTSSSGLPTFPKCRWKSASACFAEAEPCWFPQATAGGSNDRGRTHRGTPPTTSAISRRDYMIGLRMYFPAKARLRRSPNFRPTKNRRFRFTEQAANRKTRILWFGARPATDIQPTSRQGAFLQPGDRLFHQF